MRIQRVGAIVLSVMVAVAALQATTATTSDPVGVYALVEKVVFEPAAGTPQRIQVWGAFAFDNGTGGDEYQPAQVGYLYYAVQPGAEQVTRAEWADLTSVAGKGEGVGFGRRYKANGRVRPASEPPTAPDQYPIGFGLVRMNTLHLQPVIITRLKAALKTR